MMEIIMWTLLVLFIAMFSSGISMRPLAHRRLGKQAQFVRAFHRTVGYVMCAVVALHVLGMTGLFDAAERHLRKRERRGAPVSSEALKPAPKPTPQEEERHRHGETPLSKIMDSNVEAEVRIKQAIDDGDFAVIREEANGLLLNFEMTRQHGPPKGSVENWEKHLSIIVEHTEKLKSAAEAKDAEACKKELSEIQSARDSCHREFR